MSNEIEEALKQSGFHESDILLAQKLTRRGLESHLNLVHSIKSCERCALSMECHGQKDVPIVTTERVTGTGPWNSPLMIIGDMPGEHEGKYGVPFIGEEGQLLTMILAKAGVDRNAIYMTYAMKCAGMREATNDEIKMCKRHIKAEIEAVNPRVILTLGEIAMKVVRPSSNKVEQERAEVWKGKDFDVVHTHSMKTMLDKQNQQKFKANVWHDVSLAVAEVKKAKPNYSYDRVGINSL
jgi:uracil-DNA glycosylase